MKILLIHSPSQISAKKIALIKVSIFVQTRYFLGESAAPPTKHAPGTNFAPTTTLRRPYFSNIWHVPTRLLAKIKQ
jgi:hypothetical protein